MYSALLLRKSFVRLHREVAAVLSAENHWEDQIKESFRMSSISE